MLVPFRLHRRRHGLRRRRLGGEPRRHGDLPQRGGRQLRRQTQHLPVHRRLLLWLGGRHLHRHQDRRERGLELGLGGRHRRRRLRRLRHRRLRRGELGHDGRRLRGLGVRLGDAALGLAQRALDNPYIYGGTSRDYLGYSVSGAGDIDKDGYDDVLVGAYGLDTAGSSAGGVYILFGGATRRSGGASATSASDVVTLLGETAGAQAGTSVAPAGDINGDGSDDYLIGSEGYSTYTGRVYLYYGASKRPTTGSSLSSAAAIIKGANAKDRVGAVRTSTGVGDLDGDGLDDFVIGAYHYDGSVTDGGVMTLWFGDKTKFSGTLNLTDADALFLGASTSDALGQAVEGVNDFDADGYQDIMIGAPQANGGDGAAYLFLGTSSRWAGSVTTASAGVTFLGDTADNAGSDMGDWDLDKDGAADLAIGASLSDYGANQGGAIYLLYGDPSWSGNIDLSTDADAVMYSKNSFDYFGTSVNSGGDIDGDGYEDLLGGAYGYSSSTGRVVLLRGIGP
ncbi:MAG: FG-GAP repeat protein [Deltaproteobacteria bacterium]|nr:FG-GAP repeat protein [Deltaproteobacteria bacterium]